MALAAWLRLGPLPADLLDYSASLSTVVVDRHGETLYESRSPLGTRSDVLLADRLPAGLVAATLAAEDTRFYSHVGVDPMAVARAAWRNLRAWRTVEGGSTITQQTVKLLALRRNQGASSRGWIAKAREAVWALRLEHHFSKAEILALYLNIAPYGNQIEGAARASQAYFGRPVATLTAAETAFLAALPQQPTRYNPRRDPAKARGRQLRILRAEFDRRWLSAADLAVARAERLSLVAEPLSFVAPHFVERVVREAEDSAGRAPKRIETTLDAALQRTVRGIIDAQRVALTDHHAANVAVVVLDNRTNEWLAWEGSGDYTDAAHGGAIDGAMSPRQPGSALKPFTYAAAFERGSHPAQVLADVRAEFPTANPGVFYRPRNYDGRFRGPLLARAALAGSENVPAVVLASEIGVPAVAQLLRRTGLSTLSEDASHYGLGLTLGNAEVRLDELVAAYAMFARGGEFARPQSVRAIDGTAIPAAALERLISAGTAFWVTDILADADARAYIFGRGGPLEFPFSVAAKTGTSTSYHDNWAIGYTREVTVGVWVGNFDRAPLRNSSGVTGAGPIFHDVMMAAVERVRGSLPIDDYSPIATPTPDLHPVSLCALSGRAPSASCPTQITEWLPAGTKTGRCTWHSANGTVLPAEYSEWTDEQRGSVDLRTSAPAHLRTSAPEVLSISSPAAGSVFLYDPTLRAEFQSIALKARTSNAAGLKWFVNDVPLDVAGSGTPRWPLARGKHRITVRDARGNSATADVVVR